MKSKEEIIEEWAKARVVERIVEKITRRPLEDYFEDLSNDVYEVLLNKDEKLIQGLYSTNSHLFYISRILMNQIASDRSPFHTNYRKPRQQCSDTIREPRDTT